MRVSGFIPLAAAAILTIGAARPAVAQTDLERARVLYNEGRYEESIAAANSAMTRPSSAPSATLIIARARLERFRKTANGDDLSAARSDLLSLDPRTMPPQEGIEWQIGVGIALFLEDQVAAAAEAFTAVLPAARARLTHAEYEKLLEWWGTSLSRRAEGLSGDARHRAYEKLGSEVALEFERNPLSRPATYWGVIAARGSGDLEEAWGAAIAGWIRSGTQPGGRQLREDLERFVTQTLIPERAQARTGQRLDSKETMSEISAMVEQWRAVATRWSAADAR